MDSKVSINDVESVLLNGNISDVRMSFANNTCALIKGNPDVIIDDNVLTCKTCTHNTLCQPCENAVLNTGLHLYYITAMYVALEIDGLSENNRTWSDLFHLASSLTDDGISDFGLIIVARMTGVLPRDLSVCDVLINRGYKRCMLNEHSAVGYLISNEDKLTVVKQGISMSFCDLKYLDVNAIELYSNYCKVSISSNIFDRIVSTMDRYKGLPLHIRAALYNNDEEFKMWDETPEYFDRKYRPAIDRFWSMDRQSRRLQ